MSTPSTEASRRRTFAIISHPDAGKTTLTEKFLLYGGALSSEAGAVKARSGRRSATSDWMALEQQRGISITSTVLQFPYRDCIVNLLDTPGHRDFSEDTYRVLAAADAAVMVLDAAKGIEPQTLKLFDVCRQRDMPLLTFINKWDRPGLDPLELIDQIEQQIGLVVTPVTWPVGIAGDFRGVIDRRDGFFTRFTRVARGATEAPEEVVDPAQAAIDEGEAWQAALDGITLLDEVGADLDVELFVGAQSTPAFFGSALTNFGVRKLLDAIIDLVPSPSARPDAEGDIRKLDDPFSGFVFKVQANMDPSHRDRIAFLRVCSGRYRPGMKVHHVRDAREMKLGNAITFMANERVASDDAVAGDIIGIHNHGQLQIGDTLTEGEDLRFKGIPYFAPELFNLARPRDPFKAKQLQKGLKELGEEGAVQ